MVGKDKQIRKEKKEGSSSSSSNSTHSKPLSLIFKNISDEIKQAKYDGPDVFDFGHDKKDTASSRMESKRISVQGNLVSMMDSLKVWRCSPHYYSMSVM